MSNKLFFLHKQSRKALKGRKVNYQLPHLHACRSVIIKCEEEEALSLLIDNNEDRLRNCLVLLKLETRLTAQFVDRIDYFTLHIE